MAIIPSFSVLWRYWSFRRSLCYLRKYRSSFLLHTIYHVYKSFDPAWCNPSLFLCMIVIVAQLRYSKHPKKFWTLPEDFSNFFLISPFYFLFRDQSVFIKWGGPEEFVIVHIWILYTLLGCLHFFFEPPSSNLAFSYTPPPKNEKKRKRRHRLWHYYIARTNNYLTVKCSHELVDLMSEMKPPVS